LSCIIYIAVHSFITLKAKARNIHRGEVLQAAVNNSDLRITQITKRAGYSRSSYYHHISDPVLSYDILEAYGKVINYDFTDDFPEMQKYMMQDPTEDYGKLTLEEAVNKYHLCNEKYLALFEKYTNLLEETRPKPPRKKRGK
jgi:hypothetical protein